MPAFSIVGKDTNLLLFFLDDWQGMPYGCFWRFYDGLVVYRIPRQSFGFAFAGNACLNERVVTGLGKVHCIPIALLTDGNHLAGFSVNRHPIDNPQHVLSHRSSPRDSSMQLDSVSVFLRMNRLLRCDSSCVANAFCQDREQ